jgi:uroporphyrinogen decarboxylase
VRAGLREEGMDATALIGFAGAPFTVACYMIEGGGSKDFARVRTMAYAQPALFDRLMAVLTEATITYLAAQIEAGAEAVMLFDSWAGVLSPALFRHHVIAPTRQITETLEERYPHIRMVGFPRLAGTMIAPYAAETDCDAVAMDTATDPALVASIVPPDIALQGNLDPLALLSGGVPLTDQADGILAAMRGRPFVFNLGHGIVPQTPPEHVGALVDHVRRA